MSRSPLFLELQDAGLIESYRAFSVRKKKENKDCEKTSLAKMLDLLDRMDTDSAMGQYRPSDSDVELLKKKYGGKGNITVDESDPEYVRYITPYMKITGEGAFFLIQSYEWEADKDGTPIKKPACALCFHPSPRLIRRAITGEIDPKDGQPWSLSKIQADPDRADVQIMNVFPGKPENIMELKHVIDDAGSNVYKTDMYDRLIAEVHDAENQHLFEWKNRNVYYYTTPAGKKNGEQLYHVDVITSRGIIDDYMIDEQNKGILKLLKSLGLVASRRIAKKVTISEASSMVEKDFGIMSPHLVHGSDPHFEMWLEDQKKKHADNPKKLSKLFNAKSKGMPGSIIYGLQRTILTFVIKLGSINIKEVRKDMTSSAIRKAGLQAGKKGFLAVFKAILKNPTIVRLYFLAAITFITGNAASGEQEFDFDSFMAGLAEQTQLILLLSIPFAFIGILDQMTKTVENVAQSKKFDLYKKFAAIGSNMYPDYGRYPARKEVLLDATYVFDIDVPHEDIAHEDYDYVAKDHWEQYDLLEDYSPLSIIQGSTLREIRIGEEAAIFCEGPNGYRRIFLPERSLTFQWFEPQFKVEGAEPVSQYLRDKFDGVSEGTVFVTEHKGAATRMIGEDGKIILKDGHKKNGLETKAISTETFRSLLNEIKTSALEKKAQPRDYYHDRLRSGEHALEPKTKVVKKKIFGLVPYGTKEIFDQEATYPGPDEENKRRAAELKAMAKNKKGKKNKPSNTPEEAPAPAG